MRKFNNIILLYLFLTCAGYSYGQKQDTCKIADKPLYRDPVFDGAADPEIVWNSSEQNYFMFYTNRRAKADSLQGATWVHGSKIGIATSTDGTRWKYGGTCNINYKFPGKHLTFWAPDIIENNGLYHMYLTIVPGVFKDWYHPRSIAHFTSSDLMNWEYESTLDLSSERCIDASVFKLPNGKWRLYYNNENDNKSIYYADSPDLYHWTDKAEKVIRERGEGAKVFCWKGRNWMIIDTWRGLGVYSSEDFLHWKRQENNILQQPGNGKDDKVKGGHAYVVVQDGQAFIFYFTHPGRTSENEGIDNYETRRSSIQVAELKLEDGEITCNRNKPVCLNLAR